MDEPVKGTTTRSGGRRAGQARATQRRIIDHAWRLFTEQGYAATTLDQIAAGAGVALQTVYFHFGNKRTVLKEVVDRAAVGDDEPIPLLDRPIVERIRSEADPSAALALWVDISQDINARITPIMRIVRDAASSDPDMAAQWETNRRQTLSAHKVIAQHLSDQQALRHGMTVDGATDIIYALVSLDLYSLLTEQLQWTPHQWRDWTNRTLAEALLGSQSSEGPARTTGSDPHRTR